VKKRIRYYIVILLICLFNISCFSVYPESHAKYIKEEVSKLSYDATLYKLTGSYNTIGINKNLSTSTQGYFYILFDRNTLMYDNDTSDTYTITVGSNNTSSSSLCTINSVSTSGSASKVNDYVYDIVYTDNNSDTIVLNVLCAMDEDYYIANPNDYINVSLSVSENIDGEKDFTYISTSYVLTTYEEYYEIYGSLYKKAYAYIQNLYASDSSMQEVALAYFNSVFNSDEDIENNTLDGFTYDSSTGTFSVDDDFLKYARTYYSTTNGNGTYYFYFDTSTTDASQLNSLFEYYLSKYTSYTEDEYNELMTYINSKTNGIKDVIDSGLTGFAVVNDTTYNHNILSFSDSIIDIATEYNNPTTISVITIDDSYASVMKAYLKGYINQYDGLSDNVKTGLISKITNDSSNELLTLVTTNASSTGVSQGNVFSGFYYDTIDDEKIMANVYSDGSGTTNIKFYNLVEGNTVSYTSSSQITQTEYNEFINDVHEYVYETTLSDEVELVTATEEDGYYIYDYIIEE